MIKLLKNLERQQIAFILLSVACIVLQVWLDLRLPDYMSNITMLVQTEDSEMTEILKNGGYMLLCALGSMASAVVVGFFAARIGAGLSKTLREKVFS